ncbi:SDR family NAD(P)-dependent oxidoreductase [Staphylococcus schweitzeri]|uniref:SDR family NAD(P)-dependent oxidoreductase n=1 Tax=Staphylococcus schweitzeri TaxID=1654388 RepID=UPI0005068485|nr:SDR family NAD(P)-dependent oxidoreductase [Staphylococcus schweitzeri]CDR26109.1 short chain dehydrogenase [Staphylococcus schweitzeri]
MDKKEKVLITGATRGMGKAIANVLAQKGYHVIIGARKIQDGNDIVKNLKEKGLSASTVQLDVTDPDSISNARQSIESLDILINNAGVALDNAKPSEINIEMTKKEFDVNVFGVMNVSKIMIDLLKNSESAKIINMSSIMGSLTESLDKNSPIYSVSVAGYQASKSALNMYSIQLAKEFEKDGIDISVDLVDPGMVATEFGGLDPEIARQMGARPIEEGIQRVIELVEGDKNDKTITYTNNQGTVSW